MGKLFTKHKREQVSQIQPSQAVAPEDPGLQKIRKTLDEELEKFLLNNILLSVQFFEDFER